MKLRYDHNLSPKLVQRLADLFPDSARVFTLRLDKADDSVLWEYAKTQGFVIVSEDSDFSDRSLLFGHPPKGTRLHLGNCTTNAVEACLRSYGEPIIAFQNDAQRGCLHLPAGPWA